MERFRSVFWLRFKKVLMVVLGVVFVFSVFKSVVPPTDRLPEGLDAPNAKLRYVLGGEGEVQLSDLRGKGVLVNFWATWCGPCQSEIPALIRLSERYSGEHFAIIGISSESPATVRSFARARGVNYPLMRDVGGKLDRAFGVNTIPFSVFIGPDGKVVGDVTGELSESEGAERIEALIAMAKAQ